MPNELEKAQIMFKLARKDNWGAKYDRLEHFKRFPNLKQIIKELEKTNQLIIKKKPNFIGISLNTEYKKEILNFITTQIPNLKEMIN